VEKSLEIIRNKELTIGKTFNNLAADYKIMKGNIQLVELKCNDSSNTVTKLAKELSSISNELKEVKKTMDFKGSSMTDTSPLIKIKVALQNLKTEIKDYDIRIGVVVSAPPSIAGLHSQLKHFHP